MYKKLHIGILLLTSMVISTCLLGQSTMNIANGAKLKVISGTSVQDQNLDIGNGSQLVNCGDLTVNVALINDAGTTGLIIKSDENGSGSLIHNTANVPASVEQYLTSERWHLVSSPMTIATIETFMNIYLKQWNEVDSTWTYLTQPVTIPMVATTGYSAWASDNLTGTVTVNYEGNLNNGDYPISLTYTPASNATGWNLLGNPYPSAIDWNDDASWNRSNLSGWAVVYDNATFRGWNPYLTGINRTYNGKTDGIIPATQGFWVRATASGASVTIPQSQRTHNSQPFYKEADEDNSMSLRLKVSANDFEDEAVIIFMEGATNGFDGLYDLGKMYNINEAPNIYSLAEGDLYSVNVLPVDFISETDSPIIPIGFELGVEQESVIAVSGIESFDPFTPIYLEDLQEDIMVNLRNQHSYTFSSNPMDDPNRFLLHFGEPIGIDEYNENGISIYSHNASVYIKLSESEKGEAAIYDMLGKKICSIKLNDQITKRTLYQTGYFIVKVKTEDQFSIQKVFIKN